MNKKIKVLASSEDERSYKWFIPGLRPITIIKARPGVISTGLLCVKEPGVYRTEFTEVETDLLTPGRANMVIELKVLTAEEFFVEVNAALVEQMKNESYRMYWYYFKIFAAVAIPVAIATVVLYNNPEIVDSLRNFLSNLFRSDENANSRGFSRGQPSARGAGDGVVQRAKDILDLQEKSLEKEVEAIEQFVAKYTFTPEDDTLVASFIADPVKQDAFYNEILTRHNAAVKDAKEAFNRLELAYTNRDLKVLNVYCGQAEIAANKLIAADYELFKTNMILDKVAAELLERNEAVLE